MQVELQQEAGEQSLDAAALSLRSTGSDRRPSIDAEVEVCKLLKIQTLIINNNHNHNKNHSNNNNENSTNTNNNNESRPLNEARD